MHYSVIFRQHQHAAFSFLKFLEKPTHPGKRPFNVAGGCACYYKTEFLTWHKWWVKQGHAPLPYYAELVAKKLGAK